MRSRALAIAVVGLTGIVGACASDDDSTVATPTESETDRGSTDEAGGEAEEAPHNEADVAFAQMMIPHHEQAVEMSQLAPDRAEDERVLELAEQIEAAQAPEIEEMTGWLESWGEDVGGHDMGDMEEGEDMGDMEEGEDMGDMDMDDSSMPGMMSDEEMTELEALSGAEFDVMFLEMMTAHHEGALEMAETEIADGEFPDAIALAETIIETQQAEIEEMEGLLADLA
ncbi:MAG: DUF305 domain-containing protein [Acidimicrobiia bacterium]|jgi:uncharacterized protein (DUF305 family)|nr:DUF305 domain-containing protein [Acidimicrobiia bacterium]